VSADHLVPLAALILGSIVLGGGLYEALLVDRAWPTQPILIQPNRGGLRRGVFWVIAQPPFEIALLASAWAVWREPARDWVIAALVAHFGGRIWSLAYFIPHARRFETAGDFTPEQIVLAKRWVRLSRFRAALEAIAIACLAVVILGPAAAP